MRRALGCLAVGVPAGVALFLGVAYLVVMYIGHPTLLEEFP